MDRISILLETLPRESTISILYESSVAVVVARDKQERLLFKVTTTVAVAMELQAEWLVGILGTLVIESYSKGL